MKITIYGSGYVGLVTGVCFAEVGNDVLCVDVDPNKLAKLRAGECPIYEPGLEAMLGRNIDAGRIRFTDNMEDAVAHGLLQFIAVGTPPDEDGSADLQYVLQVAETVATHMDDYRVVVTKSTVPVGTADKVRAKLSETLAGRGATVPFDVVSNPEFLKEGDAVNDFMKPDRVIVGAESDRAAGLLRELYLPFNRNHERVQVMDIRSAELTKYAANAMLATKISFMNELAGIADKVGADIEQVRLGIGSDPRIGFHFIYPGCGYGGSCFPKDVKALVQTAIQEQHEPELLAAVEAVNDRQKTWPFRQLESTLGDLKGRRIALWGLAFKPRTDDMREASSLVLIDALSKAGATVTAYDPVAMNEARRIQDMREDYDLSALTLVDEPYAVLNDADALVVVTEWQEFRSPDFGRIKSALNQPVLIDGRNIYEPQQMAEAGFRYRAVGRPPVGA